MKTNVSKLLSGRAMAVRIAILALLVLGVGQAQAQNQDPDERIKAMEEQLKELRDQLRQLRDGGGPDADDPFGGATLQSSSGMTLRFYGESKYNWTKGTSGNYFDPHRYVLMPAYQINDWIFFNSEVEIEHGGVDDKDNSRFRGALELEQFYADVKINDWLNWRSLGLSLIPVGSINLYHEPTLFYSVHRPIMYKYIIPSTWMEGSTGFWGDTGVDGLSFEFLISSGIDNQNGNIDDSKGVRNTRPNPNLKSGNRQLAYSFRLAYDGSSSGVDWLKGFSGSASTYLGNYQETTTTDTSAYLWDVEAKYRIQSGALKNLEFIADYAQWHFGSPDAIADANVGDSMYGYRLETAYHIPYGNADAEIVPFFRYEGYDLSEGGKDANAFTETGSNNYLTYGTAWFLNANMVLKAGVRQSLDDVDGTEFSIGVGYTF